MALPLLLGSENIQHGHRASTGDHVGHNAVPFLHGEALNLDPPQTQQQRCHLGFLELQSPGFGCGPGGMGGIRRRPRAIAR